MACVVTAYLLVMCIKFAGILSALFLFIWNNSSQKLILHVRVRIGPIGSYCFALSYNAVQAFTVIEVLLFGHNPRAMIVTSFYS